MGHIVRPVGTKCLTRNHNHYSYSDQPPYPSLPIHQRIKLYNNSF